MLVKPYDQTKNKECHTIFTYFNWKGIARTYNSNKSSQFENQYKIICIDKFKHYCSEHWSIEALRHWCINMAFLAQQQCVFTLRAVTVKLIDVLIFSERSTNESYDVRNIWHFPITFTLIPSTPPPSPLLPINLTHTYHFSMSFRFSIAFLNLSIKSNYEMNWKWHECLCSIASWRLFAYIF